VSVEEYAGHVAVSPERLALVPSSPSWAARCGSRTIHMNSAIPGATHSNEVVPGLVEFEWRSPA
jgi:hypothetical protein